MRAIGSLPALALLALLVGSCNVGSPGSNSGDVTETPCTDFDGDGFCASDDCDDFTSYAAPDNDETTCDGLDNDCDPDTLDAPDADADGVTLCGDDAVDPDCDDENPLAFPGNPEQPCDGIDNDCNELTGDQTDSDGDGWLCDDCNDSAANVNPGMSELPCDGLDNDCNAATLDRFDNDSDGHDNCADCNDSNAAVHPGAAEACGDGIDNDCDAFIDCADSACAAQPACAGESDCTDGLDGDGDGLTDCADPDCAAAPNCRSESDCGDGIDNDSDGLTDCNDSDCAGDPSCAAAVCTDDFVIGCGYAGNEETGTNGTWGDMNLYSCTNAYADNADEHVYGFSVSSIRQVTVTLTPINGDDLNIWLLEGACDPANCVDYSHLNDPEVVTFTGYPGVEYHIVVDGWSFHTGPYNLQVSCN